MTPEAIRQALHGAKPFKLRTADGKVVDVPHPDFAAMSASGRTLVIMTGETWEVLDAFLISAIDMPASSSAA